MCIDYPIHNSFNIKDKSMKTKVVNTRKYFLDMKNTIQSSVATAPTSVDYREAVYLFCKKVEDTIVHPSNEIFKLSDEVVNKLKEMNLKIYEAGKQFALVAPRNGEPYKIAPDKIEEWTKVDSSIKEKYAEYIQQETKNIEEYNQWMMKKIQLNIEKIPSKEIPPLSIDGNESQQVYNQVRELLAEDEIELEEDDGKEIE